MAWTISSRDAKTKRPSNSLRLLGRCTVAGDQALMGTPSPPSLVQYFADCLGETPKHSARSPSVRPGSRSPNSASFSAINLRAQCSWQVSRRDGSVNGWAGIRPALGVRQVPLSATLTEERLVPTRPANGPPKRAAKPEARTLSVNGSAHVQALGSL